MWILPSGLLLGSFYLIMGRNVRQGLLSHALIILYRRLKQPLWFRKINRGKKLVKVLVQSLACCQIE